MRNDMASVAAPAIILRPKLELRSTRDDPPAAALVRERQTLARVI